MASTECHVLARVVAVASLSHSAAGRAKLDLRLAPDVLGGGSLSVERLESGRVAVQIVRSQGVAPLGSARLRGLVRRLAARGVRVMELEERSATG